MNTDPPAKKFRKLEEKLWAIQEETSFIRFFLNLILFTVLASNTALAVLIIFYL